MATKKSPPKQKQRFSRRKIIFSIIAIIAVIATVYGYVQTAQKQELERQDKEKFTILEKDMSELKSQLDKTAGVGEWTIYKECSKPGIKFYTGTAGTCTIGLVLADDAVFKLQDLKFNLNNFSNIKSEGYSDYSRKNYLELASPIDNIFCQFYFSLKDNGLITDSELFCSGDALYMYYMER